MKKSIFSLGLLCGALSVFALASCGEQAQPAEPEEPEVKEPEDDTPKVVPTTVKDFEGNEYTIEATDDSEKVAKSLVLTLGSLAGNETKHYAAGANIKYSFELGYLMEGIQLDATVAGELGLKGTVGTTAYKTVVGFTDDGKLEDPTAEQTAAAMKEIGANARFESTASMNIALKASTESEDDMVKEQTKVFNGATVDAKVKAFSTYATDEEPLTAYAEVSATVSAALYQMVYELAGIAKLEEKSGFEIPAVLSEDESVYNIAGNYKYPIEYLPEASSFTTLYGYYQGHTLEETINYFNLNKDKTGKDVVITDKALFTSAEYKLFETYIDKLGVKVTEAQDGNVTFGLDATGETLRQIYILSHADDPTEIAKAATLFTKDSKYFSISLTFDLAKGFCKTTKITIEDGVGVAALFGVKAQTGTSFKGTIEVNAFMDNDVKFQYAPNANKEYINPLVPATQPEEAATATQGEQ